MGSAKGIRWRGELPDVNRSNSASDPSSVNANNTNKHTASASPDGESTSDPDNEETAKDVVTREAPPWLVSMVLHLILLLILALITSPVGGNLGRIMLNIGQSEQESPSELAEFSISTDDLFSDADSLQDAEADVEISDLFDNLELEELEEVEPIELGSGAELAAIRPMFNGRSGAMKKALLEIYGGTAETQDAVRLGLQWLQRNQQRKGGWSMRGPFGDGGLTENEAAATAMALLAFLGDGHTHKSGEYMEEVERGMKHLIRMQDRSGFFAGGSRGHEKMYAQAQATIAICELYGMTKDSWLRDRAQLALDFAMKSQSEKGGWRYEPNFDADTSVTGWFVMALESGRSAGLEVDISVLTRVNDYLDSASSFDGAGYGYQARTDPTPPMTAEGLLCRQYISWKRSHPPLLQGIEALLLDAPFKIGDRDVYYWYYATQVLHHFGGSHWREWNDVMRVQLPKAQVKSGREAGSWAPQMDRWGRNSGRLYTTCLSLYCLEVYYRHMPLYKADGQQIR